MYFPEFKDICKDVRKTLKPGESYYIDDLGCGHFWAGLHVSDVVIKDQKGV